MKYRGGRGGRSRRTFSFLTTLVSFFLVCNQTWFENLHIQPTIVKSVLSPCIDGLHPWRGCCGEDELQKYNWNRQNSVALLEVILMPLISYFNYLKHLPVCISFFPIQSSVFLLPPHPPPPAPALFTPFFLVCTTCLSLIPSYHPPFFLFFSSNFVSHRKSNNVSHICFFLKLFYFQHALICPKSILPF